MPGRTYHLAAFDDSREMKSHNLGDFIYAVILDRFMRLHGVVPDYVRRDRLSNVNFGDDDVMVMSGFFPGQCGSALVGPWRRDVRYVGFHHSPRWAARITPPERTKSIGCRDFSTFHRLSKIHGGCYVSLCSSLMADVLGMNDMPAEMDKIVFVDCPNDFVARKRGEGPQMTFTHDEAYLDRDNHDLMNVALHRMLEYKVHAKKVYTTRLHAYLPCVAMGIPAEFVGGIDSRTEIAKIVTCDTIGELRPLVRRCFEFELFGIGDDVKMDLHHKCMDLYDKRIARRA